MQKSYKSTRRKYRGKFLWIHDSGGCMLQSTAEYCCDDWFLNTKTGKYACYLTTYSAHSQRPLKVMSLKELEKLAGWKRDLKTEKSLNARK